MATIGISEFTFGYAFLFEQTHANWQGLRAAPILPSLLQEQHEGWDAHLPRRATDYYYQFKLSDFLSHRNAKYIKEHDYNAPYYRIALHRKNRNQQHRRLRAHSRRHRHTYYVAPQFNDLTTFNRAFLQRQITNRSRLIPVNQCLDRNDDIQHYITYQQGRRQWLEHSEAFEHRTSHMGTELEDLYRSTKDEWQEVNLAYATQLYEQTVKRVRAVLKSESLTLAKVEVPLLDPPSDGRTVQSILLATAEILSVYIGVTLVLVGSAD